MYSWDRDRIGSLGLGYKKCKRMSVKVSTLRRPTYIKQECCALQCFLAIMRPDNIGRYAKILVSALISIQLLSVLRKYLVTCQFSLFSFFSAFHRSPLFDSGILRQNYGIIRGLQMNYMERTETDGPYTASDQTVQTVHSRFLLSSVYFSLSLWAMELENF